MIAPATLDVAASPRPRLERYILAVGPHRGRRASPQALLSRRLLGTLQAVLEVVDRAVIAEDWRGALVAALALWRATPAPELAELVEQLSQRAAETVEQPLGATFEEEDREWVAAAREGDVVMYEHLSHSILSGNLLDRIAALLPHGPDPRLAREVCGALAFVDYEPETPDGESQWHALRDVVGKLGDPRVPELLREAVSYCTWNPKLAEAIASWVPAMACAYSPPALPEEMRAAVVTLTARVPHTPEQVAAIAHVDAALRAAVYAQLDDDGPRHVYADWLQQRGDPRGEFIALQLSGHGDSTRAKGLWRAFRHRWYEPLWSGSDIEFRRGFPIYGVGPITEDPAWATIEMATGVPINDRAVTTSLRELTFTTSADIVQLARLTRPLEVEALCWALASFDEGRPHDDTAAALAAVSRIRVLPRLRRFAFVRTRGLAGFEIDAYGPLLGLVSDRLELDLWFTQLAAAIARLEPSPLHELCLNLVDEGGSIATLEFARDDINRFGALTIKTGYVNHRMYDAIEAALLGLPDDQISRVAYKSPRVQDAFGSALARQVRMR